jgi:GTP cyclohydrolase I
VTELLNLVMNAEVSLRNVAEDGVRALLRMADEDPTRADLIDTPARMVRAFVEMTTPAGPPPEVLLARQFTGAGTPDQMISVGPIPFVSLCEHHLLPFTGTAHIAYLPADGRIVGLSKIPRLLDWYATRLQVQERLTEQIVDALMEYLEPQGAACAIDAVHSCMSLRGVRKSGASMRTSKLTGAFLDDAATRSEFYSLTR